MNRDYNEYWSNLTASHSDHPGNRFRYDLIASELVLTKIQPARILDCGCGDGSLLAVVRRILPEAELHGIDVAGNVPIERAGVPIRFQQQDLGTPISDDLRGRFDLVLCSEVIEHVSNDDMVLSNLSSAAVPGGIVVLTTQSGNIYKTEQFLGHLRHYRIQELCSRIEKAGFQVQKAYLAGWPWLNMQKLTTHYFQDTVQTNIVHAKELHPAFRMLFVFLYRLYHVSSRHRGPQIVIVARKPAHSPGGGGGDR
jgi:2-polyprenyl-3-methyl-5-hydroxy-6-metoxy-1,4-benzoquinol methylase